MMLYLFVIHLFICFLHLYIVKVLLLFFRIGYAALNSIFTLHFLKTVVELNASGFPYVLELW